MKKNEEIKEIIITNTKELMRKKGNITIKDIAQKSYVNIAAVNYYFGDKENLLSIVINQVVSELKVDVNKTLSLLTPLDRVEDIFTAMIDIIYRFALENTGIINYMFLYSRTQKDTSNLLLKEFLSKNEFTDQILTMMSESSGETDQKKLYARYMMLFSSCCIPMFIDLLKDQTSGSALNILSLRDEEFRKVYINELIRVLK